MYCWDVVESVEENKIDGRGRKLGMSLKGMSHLWCPPFLDSTTKYLYCATCFWSQQWRQPGVGRTLWNQEPKWIFSPITCFFPMCFWHSVKKMMKASDIFYPIGQWGDFLIVWSIETTWEFIPILWATSFLPHCGAAKGGSAECQLNKRSK